MLRMVLLAAAVGLIGLTGLTGGLAAPKPATITSRSCVEQVRGVMLTGRCTGVFYPQGPVQPGASGVACVELVAGRLESGRCAGTFRPSLIPQ